MSQTLEEEEKYEGRHVYVNAGVINAVSLHWGFRRMDGRDAKDRGMEREIGLTCCPSSLGEACLCYSPQPTGKP